MTQNLVVETLKKKIGKSSQQFVSKVFYMLIKKLWIKIIII